MFATTSTEQASRTRWDVIVAGSSFSAMFFLRGLPPGLRVLVIEKGNLIDHAEQVALRDRPREDFAQINLSGRDKTWVAHTMFGGNSNCWWGQVPRFHPSDFRLFEDHGIAAPWPLDYAALEPFYEEVERIMEVAGPETGSVIPRRTPYPYPAHALSRTDRICVEQFPDIWLGVPTTRSNGGSRAICCANGVCHLCPIDSKFTILNGFDHFDRPDVQLMLGAEVESVSFSAGTASGVAVTDANGSTVEIAADVVALGTNAVNNAAILMRSGHTASALGRYLHEQASVTLALDVPAPGYFGGSSITGHCYGFYDGDHRGDAGAVLIENYNAPVSLRADKGRWTHRMKVKLIAEDVPEERNGIELDDADQPRLTWHGHTEYAARGLARAEAGLETVLPFPIEGIAERWETDSEAHIQGTHRMGEDPATSVVDRTLRVHGRGDLFALGSGAFPTCSPSNPTLTLSALALMAGESLR